MRLQPAGRAQNKSQHSVVPKTPIRWCLRVWSTFAGENWLPDLCNNQAAPPEHVAGYNGVLSLSYDGGPSPFVPRFAGLNLEHVNNGISAADRDLQFEPRKHPMEIRRLDEKTCELYQPPLPNIGLESSTPFAF